MSEELAAILAKHHKDPTQLVDMLHDLQLLDGHISKQIGLARTDIEQTVSFYHFSAREIHSLSLNNSTVAEMKSCAEVAAAFERAAGCSFGSAASARPSGMRSLPLKTAPQSVR